MNLDTADLAGTGPRAEWIDRHLEMQGFACSSGPSFDAIVPWLRFSPGLTTVVVAAGTVLASPTSLGALAVVTGLCAGTARHPFDLIYNHLLRRATGTPRLPPNPAPRRFACALATAWLVVAGLVFWIGAVAVGYALGTLLVVLGGLVATTHFCFGSLVYRLLHPRRSVPPVGP